MHVKRALLFGLLMLVWAVSAQAGSVQVIPLTLALDAFGVQQPGVYKSAPNFSLAMLGGGKKALADYRGKVVLVHFWATWCLACRHEMPQIEQLWQRYRDDGLVVLGVNVDRGNLAGVRRFVRERDLNFPSVLDPGGAVRNRYEVRALPTTYLIDQDGKIIGRIIGERKWNTRQAAAMVDEILAREESIP